MIKIFNGHVLNLNNIVELKWHPETGELVYQTTQGDWCGVAGTKQQYDEFILSLVETK